MWGPLDHVASSRFSLTVSSQKYRGGGGGDKKAESQVCSATFEGKSSGGEGGRRKLSRAAGSLHESPTGETETEEEKRTMTAALQNPDEVWKNKQVSKLIGKWMKTAPNNKKKLLASAIGVTSFKKAEPSARMKMFNERSRRLSGVDR